MHFKLFPTFGSTVKNLTGMDVFTNNYLIVSMVWSIHQKFVVIVESARQIEFIVKLNVAMTASGKIFTFEPY